MGGASESLIASPAIPAHQMIALDASDFYAAEDAGNFDIAVSKSATLVSRTDPVAVTAAGGARGAPTVDALQMDLIMVRILSDLDVRCRKVRSRIVHNGVYLVRDVTNLRERHASWKLLAAEVMAALDKAIASCERVDAILKKEMSRRCRLDARTSACSDEWPLGATPRLHSRRALTPGSE